MCYGNILSTAMVKIRKERQCFGCEQRFPAGTMLERTAEAEDGTINNFYLCPTCRDYLREHGGDIDDGCYGWGCVNEHKAGVAEHEEWMRQDAEKRQQQPEAKEP